MRIDYQPWGESLAELLDAARRAEAAGAGVVWAPELHRSAPVVSAALATATSGVGIGTGIALAFARSPMLTALSALDLDELSGGRFRLGLGSGVAKLNADWHGAEFDPPVARLRDTVSIIRAVVAGADRGDPIVHAGQRSINVRGWRRPYPPVRPSIPIYLAGVGPAMTALAGEVADGWLSHELCPPSVLRDHSWPALRRGLARAGRSAPAGGQNLDVVVSACGSVDSDARLAHRRAAGVVGFYASVRSYGELFAGLGFTDEHERAVAGLRAGRAADDLGDVISDEAAAAFTMSGTADDVVARVHGYVGLADAIKLSPPTYGLPATEIRAAQDRLLALLPVLARDSAAAPGREGAG